MLNSYFPFIFLGGFFALVLYVIIYQFIINRKGNIQILLQKKLYNYGENISFDIELRAKKDIELFSVDIELKAYKNQSVSTKKWQYTKKIEIYTANSQILEPELISGGNTRMYHSDMSLPTPENLKSLHQVESIIHKGENLPTKINKVNWQIKVVAKCKGIDLFTRESLEVWNPKN